MRTRDEHLQWCKDRANAYLEQGDIKGGITSMLSDMSKHPETELSPKRKQLCLILLKVGGNMSDVKSFVNGFI